MNRVLSLLVALSGPLALRAAGPAAVSFENDVLPILTRAGCMAGSCHAKADGQNGFQLSIFSFDPDSDYREIVYDARGRRIFPSSPDHSLLLLKATNSVPHEGDKRFEKDSEFYRVIRQWIAEGAPRHVENEPEPAGIAIEPADPVFGARPLKRAVQRHLLDRLAIKLLDGSIPDGSRVEAVMDGGELDFRIERASRQVA